MTRPLAQFALTGLLALVVVAVIGYFVLRNIGTKAAQLAKNVVEPGLSPALINGDPKALAAFDKRIRQSELGSGGNIVRVKLWTRDGKIVYSDEPKLIGAQYPLGDDEVKAMAHGVTEAELSDLSRPENQYERGQGKLLEVYLPVSLADGQPLLFETYQRFNSITAGGRTVLRSFLPAFLAALALLWAIQSPLAWSMARRLRQGQTEREELLISAVDASNVERRRIASDLHDGPVQELAGLSFALAGAADSAPDDTPPEVVGTLRESASVTRQIMRRLRALLVEIHPPNLHAAGLEAALSDLLTPLSANGVTTHLDVTGGRALSPAAEAILFRGAQEAIRNVIHHSGASTVDVSVASVNGTARLVVQDDGRGFDPEERERRREEGHIGLRLMGDLVQHMGGHLKVTSAPGKGTRFDLEVPTT
jgi:two-component system, NarL family, sensor kinase